MSREILDNPNKIPDTNSGKAEALARYRWLKKVGGAIGLNLGSTVDEAALLEERRLREATDTITFETSDKIPEDTSDERLQSNI